jgi:hypothetical protein
MQLATWQRLAARDRAIAMATIAGGSREVRVALAGVPVQVPSGGLSHQLIETWEPLKCHEAA